PPTRGSTASQPTQRRPRPASPSADAPREGSRAPSRAHDFQYRRRTRRPWNRRSARGGRAMSEDGPERCWTIGCDNEPVVDGYCAECADISPGILDTDTDADPESGDDETADPASHSPVEDGSDDANPGFESDESAAIAREAFADAIEWFHSQLDRDISDLGLTYVDEGDEQTVETAREWFHE